MPAGDCRGYARDVTIAAAPPRRLADLRVTLGRLTASRLTSGRLLGAVDAAVAVLLCIGGVAEVTRLTYSAPAAVGVISCVACTGPVAARRRIPFTAAMVASAGLVVYQVATKDPDGSFVAPAIVLVYYYAGRSAAERHAWRRLTALLGYGLAGCVLITAGTRPFSLSAAAGSWLIMLLPVAAGLVVARHTSLTRQLAQATASLRDEQQARAARMLGEERNRIARELHDVVAHHVSVMVIQAGAARLVAAGDAAAAAAALRVVEQSGREALTDLRRIMGVLRRRETPDVALSAGLAHLDLLASRTRASGVPVEIRLTGRLDQVPAAVDLVAYRVVQESLTNVVKHARPATARVTVGVAAQALTVRVTDDGARSAASGPPASGLPASGPPTLRRPGSGPPEGGLPEPGRPEPGLPGSGHGLAGMRERVELYGGTLESGRRPGGGFEVRAVLPLRAEPADRDEAGDGAVAAGSAGRPWAVTAKRWLTAVKPWSDPLLAAGWLAALELDALSDQYRRGPVAVNMAAVAVMAVAFALRRRFPLLFVLVVGLAAVPLSAGLTSAHSTVVGFYCVTVPMFTVAAWAERPRAVTGLACFIAGVIGSGLAWHKPGGGIVGAAAMACLLWAAGRLWRGQRTLAERLARTHALLAAEREDRERLAIATERARIARELHTRVARGVVAMIVQAAAAGRTIGSDPVAAAAATTAIELAGRDALGRMRDILGVLRSPQTAAQVRPQPGLGQLHALVQRLREDGRTVELSLEGDPGPLPAGVDLTAYRIVEEALAANGPRRARAVAVIVRFGGDGVEVDIAGGGLHLPPQLCLTVSERAALCHGTVLTPPAGSRVPRLLVRLPFTLPEALTA
jgi:signal transduction histidine kinase